MTARFVNFKDYSGFVLRGTKPVPKPGANHTHMQRAFYIVSRLEAANYGTVQNYDGAGMSGGPLHAIAVAPKTMKQGSLWALLTDIEKSAPKSLTPVTDLLRDAGLVLQRGAVVHRTGALASGETLRLVLSGSMTGYIPNTPPLQVYQSSKKAVETFNALFSDAKTFKAQEDFAINWLIQGNTQLERTAYMNFGEKKAEVPNQWLYFATPEEVGPLLDLAMCFYHAFSVNAPAIAAQELTKALRNKDKESFAKALFQGIGTRDFGKWKDNTDNTSRYDKTRRALRDSGFWDRDFVNTYLPENL